MNSELPLRVTKLDGSHSIESFDCGAEPLNIYLKRHALQNQNAGGARTCVAASDADVAGYYSLATGHVEHAVAGDRLRKGMARHPLPVILLARLAVDRRFQGQGLGAALLRDALRRSLNAADIVGVRAILVHAKDDAARRFYQHFNFDPSPVDPLQMFLLVKAIGALLKE